MIRIRYIIVFIGILTSFNGAISRYNINMAIFKMVNQSTVKNGTTSVCKVENITTDVADEIGFKGEYNWNDQEQGSVLGALFYGYMLGLIPSSHLTHIYGVRYVLTFSLFIYGILNLAFPSMAGIEHYGVTALCINRFLLGLVQAPTVPAMQGVLVRWSPLDQTSRMIVFQGLGNLSGSLFTFMCSGPIMNKFGWRNYFYVCGVINLVTCIIYFSFLRNDPAECNYMTDEERTHILENRAKSINGNKKVPYKAMLRSVPFWAALAPLLVYGTNRSYVFVMVPKFLNDIQGVDIITIGNLIASTNVVEFFMRILGGVIADMMYKAGKSRWFIRNLMAGMAQSIPGILLLGFYFARCNVYISAALSAGIMAFQSFHLSGGIPYVNQLCPPYAVAAHSILITIGNVGSIGLINGGSWLLQQYGNNQSTWVWIYFTTGFVSISGAVIFRIFSDAETQPWAIVKEDQIKEDNREDEQLVLEVKG